MTYDCSDTHDIRYYTKHSANEISTLLDSFENLLTTHTITPALIWPWDIKTRLRSIDTNEYIQAIHDRDTLCSLMIYKTYTIQTKEGILGLLERYHSEITDETGDRVYFPEDIHQDTSLSNIISDRQVAYINHLEAFFQGYGYGRCAITEVQSNPSIDTIVLSATNPSKNDSPTGFYKRLGFKETGYFMDDNPIMVWFDETTKYV